VDKNLDPDDNGFNSRKLWFAVGTSLAIVAVGLVAAFYPSFRPGLETVVGGQLGALALYLGSNVSNKWVLAKNGITNLVAKAESMADDDKDK
jgi:hypothetical protein